MLLQTRTTAIVLITCFLHAVTFFAGKLHHLNLSESICDSFILTGAYYLPLYYQVLGASATGAGVK